jgi:glycerol-3-phosphate acyltransferase PlsY
MIPWLITLALAYLLGSIPFGYILVKIFRKQDIRATGSGNIGATNVARSGAKGLAIATLLLDLGKAYLAVKLAQHILPGSYDLAVAAAVAAILGHIFPVWLRFHGGKGVASALGVFLALTWPSALAAVIITAGFLFIPLLIIIKHHQNIRRLISGTENRFGSRKAVA